MATPPRPPPPPPPLPPTRRTEVLYLKPFHWVKMASALQGSLWEDLQRSEEEETELVFSVSEIETIFSNTIRLIHTWKANDIQVLLTRVNMPLPDLMAALVAMDESVLAVDLIEDLIKFYPNKEELELLKSYTGKKAALGKSEQFFLELMKVPRLESKLRLLYFKIHFSTQITVFRRKLNVVNSACEEVRSSQKLKEIMKNILYLGNTLNQGTSRGAAVGFRLDSLLRLSYTHAPNSKMTLLHYLCKAFASKAPALLDLDKDLKHLESASKMQLKSLAEEMQDIKKGFENLNQELTAAESDGPASEVLHKKLMDFKSIAEPEVASVTDLYSTMISNTDALACYFGEDRKYYPFEKVTATLLSFVKVFKKAHQENVKRAEDKRLKELAPPPPPPRCGCVNPDYVAPPPPPPPKML